MALQGLDIDFREIAVLHARQLKPGSIRLAGCERLDSRNPKQDGYPLFARAYPTAFIAPTQALSVTAWA